MAMVVVSSLALSLVPVQVMVVVVALLVGWVK
jgi:hypothetical protein